MPHYRWSMRLSLGRAAVRAFGAADRLEFPKAVATITGDLHELPACCDSPAGHWMHLRTTNPVEPAPATVRHRITVTQGPGPGAAGPAMAFKLIPAAREYRRIVSAPHLVTLVRAGA